MLQHLSDIENSVSEPRSCSEERGMVFGNNIDWNM